AHDRGDGQQDDVTEQIAAVAAAWVLEFSKKAAQKIPGHLGIHTQLLYLKVGMCLRDRANHPTRSHCTVPRQTAQVHSREYLLRSYNLDSKCGCPASAPPCTSGT